MIALPFCPPAKAHEVRPAVADLKIGSKSIEISIRMSVEAFVARIDLSRFTDTNQSPKAAAHDALRALAPLALEQRLREDWPELNRSLTVKSGPQRLELQLGDAAIPAIGNQDVARDSILRFSANLPQSNNQPITFGWDKQNGPLIVRQIGVEEGGYTGYLKDGALTPPIPRAGSAGQAGWAVFGRYIIVGFEHIVPKGLDHILFVLGLFFFSRHWRPLLIQITAFTAAHTITLALAVLGLVTLPAHIVEPLIALSIVYVAVENIFAPRLRLWRPALVFGFGLLHGLGFASVLMEVGLSSAHLFAGLIGFNAGVELGQLAVVIAAMLTVAVPFGRREWYRQAIALPCSVAIAGVGAYWFIERTLG